ncbi:MAG TPA: molybdopterin converting factor subunit 1 [Candidatus Nanopelagicaceae bacterium]|nr:molybdopterin converting factor subunit 1 [Candidatus Nanopelagicaceae bacterium]
MPDAQVRVLLFASLRQAAGTPRLDLNVSTVSSVAACWDQLCSLHPQLASWRAAVRPALNQRYVDWKEPVRPGDELAFIPPVSGGASADQELIRVGPAEIDLGAMQAALELTGVGALATFVGVVRDPDQGLPVSHLTYEAYPEMAEAELARIVEEAKQAEGVSEVLVHHRTGRVARGVASVAVVVSAAHRHQALEACTYVIDALKVRAPIWKVPD